MPQINMLDLLKLIKLLPFGLACEFLFLAFLVFFILVNIFLFTFIQFGSASSNTSDWFFEIHL